MESKERVMGSVFQAEETAGHTDSELGGRGGTGVFGKPKAAQCDWHGVNQEMR